MLKNIFNEILDFILPPVCLSCETPLSNGHKYLCEKCISSLIPIDNSTNIVLSRLSSNGLIENAYSLYMFKDETPIQTLIHSFKYGQMRNIGKFYGMKLGEDVFKILALSVDLIVPVPLHISKKRERGYNQSDFICEGIGKSLNVPTLKKCLKRKRFTQTQTKLSREERINNVKGAFEIRRKYLPLVHNKNILLVDDVITTGSTILECARVLKESGGKKIIACSLALAE